MNWYLEVLKNYANFNSRARRKEYWLFTFYNTIFSAFAIFFDHIFGIAINGLGYGPVYILYGLAIFIPNLAVCVRRLHDVGKSGWMILLSLIPVIGSIWLLILLIRDGNAGENEYGNNPKETTTNTFLNDKTTSDILILTVVIWMFVTHAFWSIGSFVNDYESYYLSNTYKATSVLANFIWGIMPLSLAFTIKNKTKKIIAIVLGLIYLLYSIYNVLNQIN